LPTAADWLAPAGGVDWNEARGGRGEAASVAVDSAVAAADGALVAPPAMTSIGIRKVTVAGARQS
jgi:hypothetical protein